MHFDHPLFVGDMMPVVLFQQDVFVGSGKRFRPDVPSAPNCAVQDRRKVTGNPGGLTGGYRSPKRFIGTKHQVPRILCGVPTNPQAALCGEPSFQALGTGRLCVGYL